MCILIVLFLPYSVVAEVYQLSAWHNFGLKSGGSSSRCHRRGLIETPKESRGVNGGGHPSQLTRGFRAVVKLCNNYLGTVKYGE